MYRTSCPTTAPQEHPSELAYLWPARSDTIHRLAFMWIPGRWQSEFRESMVRSLYNSSYPWMASKGIEEETDL